MVMDHLVSADPVIHKLERFVTSNIERQLTIHDMARATATSPRTLARKVAKAVGTTPQHFAQRLRVAQAVHLLETTQRSVDDVAARVGYADPAAFRRVFRRETGETPRARRTREEVQKGLKKLEEQGR
jgi:transcriptional regulator GlxA family with amidase domain